MQSACTTAYNVCSSYAYDTHLFTHILAPSQNKLSLIIRPALQQTL